MSKNKDKCLGSHEPTIGIINPKCIVCNTKVPVYSGEDLVTIAMPHLNPSAYCDGSDKVCIVSDTNFYCCVCNAKVNIFTSDAHAVEHFDTRPLLLSDSEWISTEQ